MLYLQFCVQVYVSLPLLLKLLIFNTISNVLQLMDRRIFVLLGIDYTCHMTIIHSAQKSLGSAGSYGFGQCHVIW